MTDNERDMRATDRKLILAKIRDLRDEKATWEARIRAMDREIEELHGWLIELETPSHIGRSGADQ